MYELLTDRARKVMQLANEEAQHFKHTRIDTEHVLLALIKEGKGAGANAIRLLDVDMRKIRLEVERRIQRGRGLDTTAKLPHTPLVQNVVESAINQSRDLKHDWVGTEHLLLGLLSVGDGTAAQVLIELGLTSESVRQEVIEFGENGREVEQLPRLPA